MKTHSDTERINWLMWHWPEENPQSLHYGLAGYTLRAALDVMMVSHQEEEEGLQNSAEMLADRFQAHGDSSFAAQIRRHVRAT